MITYIAYYGVLIGIYACLLVICTVIFAIIGLKSTYFTFLDANFGIGNVTNDNKEIILHVYGTQVNFSADKRLRISFKILVLVSFHIVSLVFVDGCILSRSNLSPNSMCPTSFTTDCFYFDSSFTFDGRHLHCPVSEPVSDTNVTAEVIVCYIWMVKSQTVTTVLTQLGICSSILSLVGLFFRCLYHLARYEYWGTPIMISLGLAMTVIPIILWTIFRVVISSMVSMLIGTAFILLVNVLFLVRTVRKIGGPITVQRSSILKCNCIKS
jgi:hypothetical protein